MKYLKTFEHKELKYEIGDCVKIKMIPDYVSGIEVIPDNLFVKIIDITHYSDDIHTTYIRFETLITKQQLSGNQYFISKKMNNKEIDYCKLKSKANKFNI